MVPSTTSALSYDGEKINCTGNFTFRPGDNINDIIKQLSAQVCANANAGGGGGGGVYVETSRIITVSELENLHVTPIELLPATVGTARFVESILVKHIIGTTDYTSTITGDYGFEIHKVGLSGYEELMFLGTHEYLENLTGPTFTGYSVVAYEMVDANYAGVLPNLDLNFYDQMSLELRLQNGQFNAGGDHQIEITLIYKEITV
jgi:hypothetical protein